MLSPIIVFASASIGGFALRMNMVEDFERLAPGPVAAIDTAGRSTRGRAADITDQRLDVRRLRLVGRLSRAHFCHGGVTGNFLRFPCSIPPETNSGSQH
jgi:hypothetical protein